MTRQLAALAVALTMFIQNAWAIPSDITYQGTLKEKGVPVNATRSMIFRITNQDGTAVYWSSGSLQVDVVNGLFSKRLAPTGVDWQSVTPYMEVSVNGQLLLPREQISTSVYAVMSANIIDGAITPAKVASGYGLVPSGAIMMFTTACPNGWSRFAALDNRFPMGSQSAGVTGGSATHTHSISSDGSHKHRLPIFSNAGESILGVAYPGSSPFGFVSGTGITNAGTHPPQSSFNIFNPTNVGLSDVAGDHDHKGATGATENVPPFATVIFCQKS